MEVFNDFNNAQVASLPKHLKQYIVEQHYEHYTPVDHAVWRYVMRQNYNCLKDIAYYPYIPGLKKAGLTIEKIPSLLEMNDALAEIGWGAVTVDGFIPPVAFMEFQAYRVLVIAADIRQLKHIEYTPAPDIIHESAGHAPIIAEPDYNQYLSYFGSIGAKAMFSSKDFELYEAIRELSILKEMPNASADEVAKATKKVEHCQANLGEPSEMALLSRLHWWTVEYGLIGDLENHKIYGAGLLSSIGESASCMRTEVKKLWYNLDAVNYSYDITQQQPQLFVTPHFQNLIDTLEQFADTMAFRRGGSEGLLKAIECKNTATVVYSSGLQVSGMFTDFSMDVDNNPFFLKATGPVSLAVENKELPGHSKAYHKDGFSSPVGKLKGSEKPLEELSNEELSFIGIKEGAPATLNFESGITLVGSVTNFVRQAGKLLLITFDNCTVKDETGKVLFDPSWGPYDMAVGEQIVSVFCGAADKDAYEQAVVVAKTTTYHPEYDEETLGYHELFKRIRQIREIHSGFEELPEMWRRIENFYREDWLASLEILELLEKNQIMPQLAQDIKISLEMKASNQPEESKLIYNGLSLLSN